MRSRTIFACLHEMMASVRVGWKETLGTHVTCSSNAAGASLQAVKNQKASRTATNQRSQRRPRHLPWHGVGGFPAKASSPPTHMGVIQDDHNDAILQAAYDTAASLEGR